ncbi:tyrosine-type recombinase/integrase [Mediterraneibacter sp. NSJ-55]|uniref:Tyrosine-type recombinase/integrase n=1 Tax=Mediterraneibacter hominis TaxID=2763054 RepID=A0A923LGL0_9FIRM|nr:tyrosine-type recombinase/integrase [Mediterraneibacter hominis]MBC5687711.1 tyrosine-type recombinase/integrase [Mediterraneibacter hominis]
MSQNFPNEFVNMNIWKLFCLHFKSETTSLSYWSDIQEFCQFTEKPFVKTAEEDVRAYFEFSKERVKRGKISALTATKKFRELHSFAVFTAEKDETAGSTFQDYFYPYLKGMAKDEKFARYIPIEDMDALLEAAKEDRMAYTILTLMYRAGLSSSEIVSLNSEENFALYEEGAYAIVQGRKEPCYIPEDAWNILEKYMKGRQRFQSLFYNRSGRRLNSMYLSRMMRKYTKKAGIPPYSAQAVRNTCAYNLFAYGATKEQTAEQMGRTTLQIQRYRGIGYRDNLKKKANSLVKLKVEEP